MSVRNQFAFGFDPRFSNTAFANARSNADESKLHNGTAKAVETTLTASAFVPDRVAALSASRLARPVAVDLLGKICAADGIVRALALPPNERLAPYRFGRIFDAVCPADEAAPITLETLRNLGTEAAQCALAACGFVEWKVATRRIRAVFVLRELLRSAP